MPRRRNTPWIYRWSRVLIGAIAIAGAIATAYLTITHFGGQSVACPTSGCDKVLTSPYARLGKDGIPLSLLGAIAYSGMAVLALGPLAISGTQQKDLRKKLEDWSWLLLLVGAISMVVFSGYLMYLLFFVINSGICIYCVASALFTISMLTLTLLGREWPDMGQILFTGGIVAVVAIVGSVLTYQISSGDLSANAADDQSPYKIMNTSGASEVALAEHLTSVDAKMYGAYWCPHCHDQKELFGRDAARKINYIECDPKGPNAQPQACTDAKVTGFPSWTVKGKMVSGTQSLQSLSQLSGYSGKQDFKNKVAGPVAPPGGAQAPPQSAPQSAPQ
jgi:uncharacterized membrane protein